MSNIEMTLNNKIKDYLKKIIERIEKYNEIVQTIEYTSTTKLEDYRRAIFRYKSCFLFGQLDQSYYVYEEVVYLSQGLLEPLDNTMIKFGDIINSVTNYKGARNEIKIYNNDIKLYNINFNTISYSEYEDIINKVEYENGTSDALTLCLYYNIFKIEKDELKLCNILQNLYSFIYIFYNYTAKTILNDDFISILISLYMENKLQKMSVDDYEERLKEWYKTVRDPETDPFKGFIDDGE
jgi:hypothetical protein